MQSQHSGTHPAPGASAPGPRPQLAPDRRGRSSSPASPHQCCRPGHRRAAHPHLEPAATVGASPRKVSPPSADSFEEGGQARGQAGAGVVAHPQGRLGMGAALAGPVERHALDRPRSIHDRRHHRLALRQRQWLRQREQRLCGQLLGSPSLCRAGLPIASAYSLELGGHGCCRRLRSALAAPCAYRRRAAPAAAAHSGSRTGLGGALENRRSGSPRRRASPGRWRSPGSPSPAADPRLGRPPPARLPQGHLGKMARSTEPVGVPASWISSLRSCAEPLPASRASASSTRAPARHRQRSGHRCPRDT